MPHPRSQPDCPICTFLTMLNPSVPDEEQAICGECYDLMALTEQAATGDEDQRVEEQAKALYEATGVDPEFNTWDQMIEPHKNHFRAAIRAGWTPPESEAEK